MQEQELITSMQALTASASAVLAALVPYAEQNADVTITLANGQKVTFPSLPKQIAAYAAQQNADRVALLQNFQGVPTAQTVTRDSANRLTGTITTFATGYQAIETINRNAIGRITGFGITLKDNLNNVVATITKTIQRTNGLYAGVQ